MKLLLLSIVIVAFCVLGLSFNIIFKKNGKFPDGEIEHNKALRKEGIRCAKVEERKLWGKKVKRERPNCNSDCGSCGLGC
jgi:hypothetical protein